MRGAESKKRLGEALHSALRVHSAYGRVDKIRREASWFRENPLRPHNDYTVYLMNRASSVDEDEQVLTEISKCKSEIADVIFDCILECLGQYLIALDKEKQRATRAVNRFPADQRPANHPTDGAYRTLKERTTKCRADADKLLKKFIDDEELIGNEVELFERLISDIRDMQAQYQLSKREARALENDRWQRLAAKYGLRAGLPIMAATLVLMVVFWWLEKQATAPASASPPIP